MISVMTLFCQITVVHADLFIRKESETKTKAGRNYWHRMNRAVLVCTCFTIHDALLTSHRASAKVEPRYVGGSVEYHWIITIVTMRKANDWHLA